MNSNTKLEIDVAKMQENIKSICESIGAIRTDVSQLRTDIKETYATKEELKPIQRFMQGMQGAGFVVLMGILALVLAHTIPGFKL